MKIINDIIMSIKNFLSYIFKDNDPTATDLFDSNWGNGVTERLKQLSRAQPVTIGSDDRLWHDMAPGTYFVGGDGITLGYPNTWMFIHHTYNGNVLSQIATSPDKGAIYSRQANTSQPMTWNTSGLKRLYSITQGNGVTNLAKNKITVMDGVVYLEIAGTFTTGTGNKTIGTVPLAVFPDRGLRVLGVCLATASTYGAQQFIIYPGTGEIVAEAIPTTAQGGAFQLNISYTL
ncbi:hypothetical protein [Erysipelothrix anatis]|uniref:hypothetical protein n=1 Tax=Erysipelothrix anatis TaxID=2683713 RepID=UPI00135AE2C3|nr:hypothetical protein [Erysipelothrix anatis]